jgi:hypothetical protein
LIGDGLGVSPADVLQMFHVLLLVEGSHDQAVIEGILRDRLATHRCRVLPLRGTRGAVSAVEAELLFDATDAAIVFVVDNVKSPGLDETWREAKRLLATTGSRAAIQEIMRWPRNRDATREEKTIRSVLFRAARTARAERVLVFGFSKPDIIEYFEPQDFGLRDSSWEELVREWKKAPGRRTDFKTWLRQSKGARISEKGLAKLASRTSWESAHDDFRTLDHVISEAVLFGQR